MAVAAIHLVLLLWSIDNLGGTDRLLDNCSSLTLGICDYGDWDSLTLRMAYDVLTIADLRDNMGLASTISPRYVILSRLQKMQMI